MDFPFQTGIEWKTLLKTGKKAVLPDPFVKSFTLLTCFRAQMSQKLNMYEGCVSCIEFLGLCLQVPKHVKEYM